MRNRNRHGRRARNTMDATMSCKRGESQGEIRGRFGARRRALRIYFVARRAAGARQAPGLPRALSLRGQHDRHQLGVRASPARRHRSPRASALATLPPRVSLASAYRSPVPWQRWHFTTLSPFLTKPLPSQFLHLAFFLTFGPFSLAMMVSRIRGRPPVALGNGTNRPSRALPLRRSQWQSINRQATTRARAR